MVRENLYDVIIIGGSYSGLAAGMALGRALRKVLIIDSENPCNKQTPYSHNFLTNDGKTPKEILRIASQELRHYETVERLNGLATEVHKKENWFEIQLQTGKEYFSKKLILATGIRDLLPEIPGFSDCWGISVLHCPYCHGYEVRNQVTGILANGDTGFELSALISNWTKHLTLFTNGKCTLTVQQKEKLLKHGIEISEKEIESLEHISGNISNIVFKDGSKATLSALYARPPFVQHSSIPIALGCEITPEGYIKIDGAQRTTIPGIYACGDSTTRMRTVANAVSMGTTTGLMINKELIEENF